MSEVDVLMPILTTLGRESLINAKSNGISVEMTHLSFGTGQYAPKAGRDSLDNELRRIQIQSLRPVRNSSAIFEISAVLADEVGPDPQNRFPIGEIGIWGKPDWAEDPILYGVLSQPEEKGPISQKFAGQAFLFSSLFYLIDGVDVVEIESPEINLNLSILDEVSEWALTITETHTRQIDLLERLERLEQGAGL